MAAPRTTRSTGRTWRKKRTGKNGEDQGPPQRRKREDSNVGEGKDDTKRREAQESDPEAPNPEGKEADDYAEGIDGDQREEQGSGGEVIHTRCGEDQQKDNEPEQRRSRSPQQRWGQEKGGYAKGHGKGTEEKEGETDAPKTEGTEVEGAGKGVDTDKERKAPVGSRGTGGKEGETVQGCPGGHSGSQGRNTGRTNQEGQGHLKTAKANKRTRIRRLEPKTQRGASSGWPTR